MSWLKNLFRVEEERINNIDDVCKTVDNHIETIDNYIEHLHMIYYINKVLKPFNITVEFSDAEMDYDLEKFYEVYFFRCQEAIRNIIEETK